MNTSVTNNHPFQVGQRVVCVDNSKPKGLVFAHDGVAFLKKGNVYQIKGVNKFPCGCWGVDVGAPPCIAPNGYSLCTTCNKKYWDDQQIAWFRASRFAPIIESYTDICEELAKDAMNVGDTSDLAPFTKRELQKQIS